MKTKKLRLSKIDILRIEFNDALSHKYQISITKEEAKQRNLQLQRVIQQINEYINLLAHLSIHERIQYLYDEKDNSVLSHVILD